MLANWRAVTALATELIAHGRIEGDQVERIIDYAMGSRARGAAGGGSR
jgi:hypothetical protein